MRIVRSVVTALQHATYNERKSVSTSDLAGTSGRIERMFAVRML